MQAPATASLAQAETIALTQTTAQLPTNTSTEEATQTDRRELPRTDTHESPQAKTQVRVQTGTQEPSKTQAKVVAPTNTSDPPHPDTRTEEKKPLEPPPAPPEQPLSGVGKLFIGGTFGCTAFLISPLQALTAIQCASSDAAITLRLGQPGAEVSYVIRQVTRGRQPFAMLALETPASSSFEPLNLHARRPTVNEEVFIAHYTRDAQQTITRVQLRAVSTDGLVYRGPTDAVSMGAPVIAVTDRSVLGIHSGSDVRNPDLQHAILVPSRR